MSRESITAGAVLVLVMGGWMSEGASLRTLPPYSCPPCGLLRFWGSLCSPCVVYD